LINLLNPKKRERGDSVYRRRRRKKEIEIIQRRRRRRSECADKHHQTGKRKRKKVLSLFCISLDQSDSNTHRAKPFFLS
jgi:hypothetical protein